MDLDTGTVPWWGGLLACVLVGGFVVNAVRIIIRDRRLGNRADPLPPLDPIPRRAVVRAVHPAPSLEVPRRHVGRVGGAVDWLRGLAPAEMVAEHQASLLQDARLVEVELADVEGVTRRACLADVIPADQIERLRIGTEVEVLIFEERAHHLRPLHVPGGPAPARCLLALRHDDVPRAGFDLDGVRARTERERWSGVRTGSPVLGVMKFATEQDPFGGAVRGRRTSHPGDPHSVWAGATSIPSLRRPRKVPWPESIEEVARWEDPDGFGRTWHYHAPIFWVCLPLAALGFLIWGTATDPGDGWMGNLFDEDYDGQLWNFWLVWVAVLGWLLVAIGVLVFRVSATGQVRAANAWIHRHGVPCTIHRSPHDRDDGEGGRWPTFIALDHRLDDQRAARIHHALSAWVAQDEAQAVLGSEPGGAVISSSELFGPQAEGGWFVEVIPGSGPVGDSPGHRWILLTQPRDPEQPRPTITTVPVEKTLLKVRSRVRRKAARTAQGGLAS